MQRKVPILLVGILILFGDILPAQIPRQIHYQGRLFRSNGEPEEGAIPFKFRLYNTPEDLDGLLWEEGHGFPDAPSTEPVIVENGFYEITLGKYVPIPPEVFSGTEEIYLEIQVGANEPPMTPRQKILTVPYAFIAYDASRLGGKVPEEFLPADALIAHASDPSAHHPKTTRADEITSGVFSDARIPDTVARKTDLSPINQKIDAHTTDFNNPHRVTLDLAAKNTSHTLLKDIGTLPHNQLDAHVKGTTGRPAVKIYDHTCPSEMVQVGYSCIDKKLFRETSTASPLQASWFDAAARCAQAGKRLCSNSEWYGGCANRQSLGIEEIGSAGEWVDDWTESGFVLVPIKRGASGCTSSQTTGGTGSFRCCR